MWTLPILILVAAIAVSIPLSRYMAWIMDGRYRTPRFIRWFESKLDSGPQNWKQYTIALLVFNAALFVFGFVVLSVQPLMPLNPLGRGMLSPSTIFNTVISFMTNTNLQHYSGDQHFSNFSQIFFILPNMFLSASVGLCALTAIIRALRGEALVGNFFVDMWRVVVYMFVPVALIVGVIFIHQGMPMTYASAQQVTTLEPAAMGTAENGQPKQQTLIVGPVAAVIPIKMLGTNGGGFYGMNSAHPYENPSAGSNYVTTLAMMIFPFALVLMYGRMLGRLRHAVVIYSVMLSMMIGLIVWAVYWDTLKPNPAFTAHAASSYQLPGAHRTLAIAPVAALPVDQHLGNLEGKELRFGTSAGATFAAITTDVTCGAVNAEHDSLNPLAGLSPLIGMWINCVFGG
jgi:K+-transporting ATPase ATPase A chain